MNTDYPHFPSVPIRAIRGQKFLRYSGAYATLREGRMGLSPTRSFSATKYFQGRMILLGPNVAQPARIRAGRRSPPLRRELAEHLRQNRARLLEEWSKHIDTAPEPMAMSKDVLLEKAALAYDDYVAAVTTGRMETLQSYFGRRLPGDLLASGVEAHEVFDIIGLLREMLASNVLDRSLFIKFRHA
jgi:hypothetical protein